MNVRIEIKSVVETITPEIAKSLLSKMQANRPVRCTKVMEYASDMRRGLWRITGEPIIINAGEFLIDGQHRLLAVIEADCAVPMLVVRGVEPDRELMGLLNNGLPRNLTDRMRIGGVVDSAWGATHTAIVKCMYTSFEAHKTKNLTSTDWGMLAKKNYDSVMFAMGLFSQTLRGVSTAPTMAVVARAFYSVERDTLSDFTCILLHGTTPDRILERQHGAAVLLREWLISNPLLGGAFYRMERYRKTERALYAFVRQENIGKLYTSRTELFPLPKDHEIERVLNRV